MFRSTRARRLMHTKLETICKDLFIVADRKTRELCLSSTLLKICAFLAVKAIIVFKHIFSHSRTSYSPISLNKCFA